MVLSSDRKNSKNDFYSLKTVYKTNFSIFEKVQKFQSKILNTLVEKYILYAVEIYKIVSLSLKFGSTSENMKQQQESRDVCSDPKNSQIIVRLLESGRRLHQPFTSSSSSFRALIV